MWLITAANPSDSGAVHSDVRKRWEAGDQKVVQAMRKFASYAEQGRFA
jgi:glucuronokinase